MASMIMKPTLTWMPVAHLATSAYTSAPGGRPLAAHLGVQGQVCPSGATSGYRWVVTEPVSGHVGLGLSGAMSGAQASGLPVNRSAGLRPVADVLLTADVRPAASLQGASGAGIAVEIPVPTQFAPTTTVRNEKQRSGPSVLRPPV